MIGSPPRDASAPGLPPVPRALSGAGPLIVAVLSFPALAAAGDAADYVRSVKPLLKARCYACHGALKQEAGLRLDTGDAIRRGGDSGPAAAPGIGAASLILARVTDSDAASRMPPEGAPLPAEEVALLRAWIDGGARSPAGESPEADPRDHWAFRPPKAVPPPPAAAARNPIDGFLAAERGRRGAVPLPPAEPHVLLRRVHLDLTGLPPTREQLRAFLADPSDEAYGRVVDRLLADPRHGERWARHWMDVWRYSDWYGRRTTPDVLNSYGMIWRWRDWIVRSLNGGRPYDDMARMMLAADELDPADDADLAATGFLVRNFFRWNYESWKKDNVEHVAKAFLGLTVACAHCHDHKYDPVTQEDYFALRACFEPLELRHDRVPGEPDPGPYPKYVYGRAYPPIASGMVRVIDERLDAETRLYARGEARNVVPGRPPIPPGVPAFLGGSFRVEPVDLPPEAYYPGLKAFVRLEELAPRRAAVSSAETEAGKVRGSGLAGPALAVAEAALGQAKADLAQVEARIAADDAKYGRTAGDAGALARAASRAERESAAAKAAVALAQAEAAVVVAEDKAKADPAAQAEVAAAEGKRDAARQALGAARAAVETESDAYTPVGPVYPSRSTGRRAALARWITDPGNPLTARVAVNHVWRWHFGTPLVESTADFGRNGASPTHPELLDRLAVEFVESGWDMKRLHRLIVTSAAYRARSHAAPDHPNRTADPENRTYWHFPPARVEAEVLRDGLLHVAGRLDGRLGGVDIDQAQALTSRRRSLYLTHHGEARAAFLDLFDAPDPCDCYRRTASVVPQQALALTNNEMVAESSRELEARLWEEAGAVTGADREGTFVGAAFEAVLSRPPSPQEYELSTAFLARQAAVPPPEPTTDGPATRARRGFVRALFNHNDFVTIR